jgi:hypothetical protein
MTTVDLAAVRAEWVGRELETTTYEVREADMVAWAEACGETEARFVDPAHPDFQAHPTFTSQFMHVPGLPDDFPRFSERPGMDGGKSVELFRPLRAGERLEGTASVADVYDKTGRSGTMYFVVHRTRFRDEAGEEVAVVDWRLITPGEPA